MSAWRKNNTTKGKTECISQGLMTMARGWKRVKVASLRVLRTMEAEGGFFGRKAEIKTDIPEKPKKKVKHT